MTWRMLDLFSGIGGFSLAAQWCWGNDLEIVAFCEIDPFCRKVLRKNFGDQIPIIEDVKKLDGKQWTGTVDLITGGFPCQPFSTAGKQRGAKDDRYLWPEMFRIISEVRPSWIVGENVANLVNMELGQMLSDLESIGYEVGPPFILPACAVNADHRRDRVWIIAYFDQIRCNGRTTEGKGIQRKNKTRHEAITSPWQTIIANSERQGFPSGFQQFPKSTAIILAKNSVANNAMEYWQTWNGEPDLANLVHGLPEELDASIALGNAIVPQVAYQIMKAIKEIEQSISS